MELCFLVSGKLTHGEGGSRALNTGLPALPRWTPADSPREQPGLSGGCSLTSRKGWGRPGADTCAGARLRGPGPDPALRRCEEPGPTGSLVPGAACSRRWQIRAIKALSALLNGTKKRRIND